MHPPSARRHGSKQHAISWKSSPETVNAKKGRQELAAFLCNQHFPELIPQNRLSYVDLRLGSSQSPQRNKSVLRHYRLLLLHDFAIEGSHASIVSRIVLLRTTRSRLFGVARPLLLFARVLGDAQLVEIVLFFVGHELILQQ